MKERSLRISLPWLQKKNNKGLFEFYQWICSVEKNHVGLA